MNCGVAELRHKRTQLLSRLQSEQRQAAVLSEQLARVKERLAATWSSNQQLLWENSQLRQALEDGGDTAVGASSSEGNGTNPQHAPVLEPLAQGSGPPPHLIRRSAGGCQDGAPPGNLLTRHHSAPWEMMASPSMLVGLEGSMAPPAMMAPMALPGGATQSPMGLTRTFSCSVLSSTCVTSPAAAAAAAAAAAEAASLASIPQWAAGGGGPTCMPGLQSHGSGTMPCSQHGQPPAIHGQQLQQQQQQQQHLGGVQAGRSGEWVDARRMSSSSPPADFRAPTPQGTSMPPAWPLPLGGPPTGAASICARAPGDADSSGGRSWRPPMPMPPGFGMPPVWDGAPGGGAVGAAGRPQGPPCGFVRPAFPWPHPAAGPGAGPGGGPDGFSPPLPPMAPNPSAGRPLSRCRSSPYLPTPASPTWGSGGASLYRSNSSSAGFMASSSPTWYSPRIAECSGQLPMAGLGRGGPVGAFPLPPHLNGSRPPLAAAAGPWPPHGAHGTNLEPGCASWAGMPSAVGVGGGGAAAFRAMPTPHALQQPAMQGPPCPLPAFGPPPHMPNGGSSSGCVGMVLAPPKLEVPSPVLSATVVADRQGSGTDAAWGTCWSPGHALGGALIDGDDAGYTLGYAATGAAAAAAAAAVAGPESDLADHLDLTVDQVEDLLGYGTAWPCSSSSNLLGSPARASSSAAAPTSQLHRAVPYNNGSGAAAVPGCAASEPPASDSSNLTYLPLGVPLAMAAPSDAIEAEPRWRPQST